MSTDTSSDDGETETTSGPEVSETQEHNPHTCRTCGNVFDRAVVRCCPVCKRERERERT